MNDEIHHQAIKIVTGVSAPVAAVGLTDAATLAALIASVLAAIYTAALLGEWVWKRLLKPWFIRRRWFGQGNK